MGMRHNGKPANRWKLNGGSETRDGIMNPAVRDGRWTECNRKDFRNHWKNGCLSETSKGCPTDKVCKDKDRNCDDYKRRGYCKREFVPYMMDNCAKTCKV